MNQVHNYDEISSQIMHDENGTIVSDNVMFSLECSKFWSTVYLNRLWPGENVLYSVPLDFIIPHTNFPVAALETDIRINEVQLAINSLSSGTSAGSSDILPEMVWALNDFNLVSLLNLFQEWWRLEFIPYKAQLSWMQLLFKSDRNSNILDHRTVHHENPTYIKGVIS